MKTCTWRGGCVYPVLSEPTLCYYHNKIDRKLLGPPGIEWPSKKRDIKPSERLREAA